MSGRASEASCLSRGTPELSQAFFRTGLPGARSKDKFQIALRNSTWSPVWTPTWKKGPFSNRSGAQSSFSGKLTSEFRTPHSLQLLGLGKSFRLGPNKPVRSPKWHFSGREHLLASLRGSFLTNGGHSDLQTPQGIRETLKKPRSRVPRSPPANDLRSRMAIQRSHTE
ncbi:hypothetical protein CRG98_044337 [Punica granatum]|uniref:Uncharacterized protein n=1 Tax=Punica granatum TaxID=22663 RepID=A0A2I0HU90_PUNGR|nr:hypothetical protein CRG98_044337 [Punica granatum]